MNFINCFVHHHSYSFTFLKKEMAMNRTIREKGSAAMMSIFWNPSIPQKYITIVAIDDNISPETTLTVLGGFNCPPELNSPSTKITESAAVRKKIAMTKMYKN